MPIRSLPSRLVVAGAAVAALSSIASVAQAKDYQGAEVYSAQQVLYGRMEMRMWMARGSGLLSTFFMYKNGSEVTGTAWEEIDIEVKGKDNAQIWQSNLITGVNRTKTSAQLHDAGVSLADGWHTFMLDWTPNYVSWSVDGQEVRRTDGTQATNQVADLISPEGLRFNLWAANLVDWAGAMDPAALPAYQAINWIKYYHYDAAAAEPFVLDWTDEFDTFDTARWSRANWTFGENLADFSPSNAEVKQGALLLALTPTGQAVEFPEVPSDPLGGTTGTATSLGKPGGAAGAAGGAGTGAAGAGTAGTGTAGTGTAGTGGVGLPSEDDSSSGCSVARRGQGNPWVWSTLGVLGLSVLRRRQRPSK